MDNALLSTHLSWQGGAVLGLLFLSILLAHFIKSFPKDLIFTFAALFNALFGIVSSIELYKAGVNQAILMVLGLWLIGKAFEQQGVFHLIISSLVRIKKKTLLSRTVFLLQVAFYGAFLNQRDFLQSMAQRFEKEKGDLSILGFPLVYLFLIGGLTTAIGTPVNMTFLFLYSNSVPEVISRFFAFLPLAILPILLSLLLFLIFHKAFTKKPLELACVVVLPDSLICPPAETQPLRAGYFISISWKGWAALFLFFAAIAATFLTMAIGTAFFIGGLLLLLTRPFSIRKTFNKEFPLPLLLEIFTAAIFFIAMQNSGLSKWTASLIQGVSPFIFLPLCFFIAQIAAHFMPRPLAFAVLFSIAFSLFERQSDQLFLAGANLAFASAVPLFGTPKIDEIAISHAVSGRSPIQIRMALILILFASIAIPSCLFWPFL